MARFLSLRAEYSVVCFEEKEPRSRGELKDPLPVLARLSRVLEDVDTTLSLRPTWRDLTTDVWVRSLRRSTRISSKSALWLNGLLKAGLTMLLVRHDPKP